MERGRGRLASRLADTEMVGRITSTNNLISLWAGSDAVVSSSLSLLSTCVEEEGGVVRVAGGVSVQRTPPPTLDQEGLEEVMKRGATHLKLGHYRNKLIHLFVPEAMLVMSLQQQEETPIGLLPSGSPFSSSFSSTSSSSSSSSSFSSSSFPSFSSSSSSSFSSSTSSSSPRPPQRVPNTSSLPSMLHWQGSLSFPLTSLLSSSSSRHYSSSRTGVWSIGRVGSCLLMSSSCR